MTLKLIGTTFLIGVLLASCNSVKKTSSNTDSHTSQNSLDWQGAYYGVTPCASCPGIETELTLTGDQNYVLTRKYIDRAVTDTVKGKFNWKGNQIKLKGIKSGDAPSMYKVEEGKIRQLDMKGAGITGQLAKNYVLIKNGNLSVENKRWKLIELYGKPIKGTPEAHYIIFHAKDGKIEAKANCNVIFNNYKIRNQYQLIITPGITTLMACPDNIEQELVKVLAEADNLSVNETNLSLNKARMAPLARFELVK
ncbi:copper resistance protein NlpE N-terminal domain-containing protein [Agriterribacter sp.]|uniref:copper resistance protein NlpE N-terminal domain-containing protein n=1 Tax=Agriterribacter sp. TaxID=2821509 RepID=UPI002BF52BBC|nr:copper resistance protein NlpE N-terminal domain-containing protein [Agriterribacter sp.]HTN08318.1 copper resistance protein NlpE N-terminal domain-containing protein [Agriterribacter sp.]